MAIKKKQRRKQRRALAVGSVVASEASAEGPQAKPRRLGGGSSWGVALFAVAFVAAAVILCGLAVMFHQWDTDSHLEQVLARLTGYIMPLFGIVAQVQGNTIHLPHASLVIIPECTGSFVVAVYVSFVLAFPTAWRPKLIGLAAGIPFLLVINQIRLVVLCLIATWWTAKLKFFHEQVWEVGFVMVVVLTVAAWLELIVKRERRRSC